MIYQASKLHLGLSRYIIEFRMKGGFVGGMIGGVYNFLKSTKVSLEENACFQSERVDIVSVIINDTGKDEKDRMGTDHCRGNGSGDDGCDKFF